MSTIWITWEIQRRNRSLARSVGATLHELTYRGNALARYLVLGIRTLRIIRRDKPEVVFFQNPSIVLAFLIATLRFFRIVRARTVGDFHNGGVFPPVGGFLIPWIVRNTSLVILSNRNLESAITVHGGRCISIPDPLPHIEPAAIARADDRFDVLFICSWAADEPIVEVLRAAQILEKKDPGVRVGITGRPKLAKVGWNDPVPRNVELTGFLAEADFDRRLASADAILDLTTRADCMVCGAYEAVSAGVPSVLSDNEPTRAYFTKGVLFTDNTAADIADRLLEIKGSHERLKSEVTELKADLLAQEEQALQKLKALVFA